MDRTEARQPGHQGSVREAAQVRIKAQDSPRWCEICRAWGNHHTDKHDPTIQVRRERCPICGGFNPGDPSHVRCM